MKPWLNEACSNTPTPTILGRSQSALATRISGRIRAMDSARRRRRRPERDARTWLSHGGLGGKCLWGEQEGWRRGGVVGGKAGIRVTLQTFYPVIITDGEE